MFNAVWKQLDKHKLVALLSCLVPCSEGEQDDVKIPMELSGALGKLQELAGYIADVSNVRCSLVAAAGCFRGRCLTWQPTLLCQPQPTPPTSTQIFHGNLSTPTLHPEPLQECGLEMDKEQYVLSFTTRLMVPLYQWSQGASFAEVTRTTSIYEGSLIRCARRLMELMTQLIAATDKVGDAEMRETLTAALATIQRDIMFYQSLYL